MLRHEAWSVHYSSRDLPQPEPQPWHLQFSPAEWELWLDDLGIPDGTPYLLSPRFVYDTDLNSYFHRVNLLEGPLNSQINRASALCRKLNFLHESRGGKDWRDAAEADHTAYHYWRRLDPRGPRVGGDTWIQEVSHIQQFYVYAKRKHWVSDVPIPQRPRRDGKAEQKGNRRRSRPVDTGETVPSDVRSRHRWRGYRVASRTVLPTMAGRGGPRLRL